MQIVISGRQLDVGEALRDYVTNYIETAEVKFAERPTEARVTFSKNGAAFDCEVSMHLSTGVSTIAKAESHDIYSSFKQSYDKLEKQLRRYKRKLKDHH
ncbi:MAG: ribosome-associated translation inhibitor RaiA [Rhodobacteraceae bacterium]|nr:ribosome-associated translation inhibitor RaiA [Paracoccaceae bacterium]